MTVFKFFIAPFMLVTMVQLVWDVISFDSVIKVNVPTYVTVAVPCFLTLKYGIYIWMIAFDTPNRWNYFLSDYCRPWRVLSQWRDVPVLLKLIKTPVQQPVYLVRLGVSNGFTAFVSSVGVCSCIFLFFCAISHHSTSQRKSCTRRQWTSRCTITAHLVANLLLAFTLWSPWRNSAVSPPVWMNHSNCL